MAIDKIKDFIKGNATILSEFVEVNKEDLPLIDTTGVDKPTRTPYQELLDEVLTMK